MFVFIYCQKYKDPNKYSHSNLFVMFPLSSLLEIQEAQVHPVLCVQPDGRRADWGLRGEHPDMGQITRRRQDTGERGQR